MARQVLQGLSGKTNRRFVLVPPRQGRRVGTTRYKSCNTRALRVFVYAQRDMGERFFGYFLVATRK